MTSRNQSLDVLRGVAVILVILSHARVAALDAGWVGVDLFFVLSGFLISGLLFLDLKRCGKIRFSKFLLRRGCKIYPPYFFFLGLTAWLFPHLRRYVPMQTVFLQNYLRPANATHVLDPVYHLWDHTWSLAVEEHFYLALPVLLILLNWRKRAAWILPGSAFLAVLCFGLRWHFAAVTGAPGGRPMFLTHLRIDALFVGVVLGYIYHFRRESFNAWSKPHLGMAGLAIVALSVGLIEQEFQSPFLESLTLTLNVIGFALIVLWIVPRQIPHTAWLSEIGRYSYSIYLWHTIVAAFWSKYPVSILVISGELVCSIAIGTAMAVIVELPVLKLRDRLLPARLPL